MESIESKYARLLVNYSLKLQKGQRLLIVSSYQAEPLIREVYREAVRAGAFVDTKVALSGLEKIWYDHASEDQLRYVSPLTKYVYENYEALLHIEALFNVKELQNVDAGKKQTAQMARAELNKIFMRRAAAKELKWTLCVWPTDTMAQESGMSREEYAQFVFGGCYLYDEDPVAKWNEIECEQQRMVDRLNKATTVRFTGKDIDISCSTQGRTWINSVGDNNMPSGEVFTGPVEESVNGHIRFSYPGIYMGQEIEDISLEVKDGEIVKGTAKKGQDLLDKILQIPGAKRFGEIAVGTNYNIQKFTRNMLFDEKIGGTIHFAIGAAYPETGAKNESSVHWDLLADMKDGGRIYADGEVVYENGRFII
ncbi:MAG: peptidase M29 [Planctomycetes bacterium GWF2_42_9]|nr:MAG: peptidase M29 [Planctomycetes bacterium GWF2_42_9]